MEGVFCRGRGETSDRHVTPPDISDDERGWRREGEKGREKYRLAVLHSILLVVVPLFCREAFATFLEMVFVKITFLRREVGVGDWDNFIRWCSAMCRYGVLEGPTMECLRREKS